MAGVVVLALAVPALREDVLLLEVTRTGVLVALAAGAAGALLVELTARLVPAAAGDRSRSG
jgi:hypothetical protein